MYNPGFTSGQMNNPSSKPTTPRRLGNTSASLSSIMSSIPSERPQPVFTSKPTSPSSSSYGVSVGSSSVVSSKPTTPSSSSYGVSVGSSSAVSPKPTTPSRLGNTSASLSNIISSIPSERHQPVFTSKPTSPSSSSYGVSVGSSSVVSSKPTTPSSSSYGVSVGSSSVVSPKPTRLGNTSVSIANIISSIPSEREKPRSIKQDPRRLINVSASIARIESTIPLDPGDEFIQEKEMMKQQLQTQSTFVLPEMQPIPRTGSSTQSLTSSVVSNPRSVIQGSKYNELPSMQGFNYGQQRQEQLFNRQMQLQSPSSASQPVSTPLYTPNYQPPAGLSNPSSGGQSTTSHGFMGSFPT